MDCRFIINLNTDNGLKRKDLDPLKERFRHVIRSFHYACPASREEAEETTRRFLMEGADRIVAVGGDGTVNAIANGFFHDGKLINPSAALIVGRAGSGWDYYRSITANNTPADWLDQIAHHEVKAVDVGRVGFDDPRFAPRYFLNMASAGMVAEVVKVKEHVAHFLPSKVRYLLATLAVLGHAAPRDLTIEADGSRFDVSALAVTVSKGKYAGGGMRFGLEVELDDGRFELTVFKKTSAPRMALKLGKVYTGKYAAEEEIMKIYAADISIRGKIPAPCEFDGEIHGETGLRIGLLPKALNVCFPLPAPPAKRG